MAEILQRRDAARWVTVSIEKAAREEFKQATRGRPGKDTVGVHLGYSTKGSRTILDSRLYLPEE